jgi:hypothetical protein
LSWAVTLLGAQQLTRICRSQDSQPKPPAAEPLDVVSNAVEEQFLGAFRGVYKVGTEWLTDLAEGRTRRS